MNIYFHRGLYPRVCDFPFRVDPGFTEVRCVENSVVPIIAHTPGAELDHQRELWNSIQGTPRAVLLMLVFATDDSQTQPQQLERYINDYYDFVHCDKILVHTDPCADSGVFYDLLLRRTQALMFEQRWDLLGLHWCEHSSTKMFELADLITGELTHTVLSPTRVYPNSSPRMQYRQQLLALLADSVHSNTTGKGVIPAQETTPELAEILATRTQSLWQPVHNSVYQTSLVSAYVESTVHGPTLAVTEKTWDPLVKGHFTLPFAPQGYIEHLRRLGVQFAPFIDYSYDLITDHQRRWELYSKQVQQCANLSLAQAQELKHLHRDILEHNRELVRTLAVKSLADCIALG